MGAADTGPGSVECVEWRRCNGPTTPSVGASDNVYSNSVWVVSGFFFFFFFGAGLAGGEPCYGRAFPATYGLCFGTVSMCEAPEATMVCRRR